MTSLISRLHLQLFNCSIVPLAGVLPPPPPLKGGAVHHNTALRLLSFLTQHSRLKGGAVHHYCAWVSSLVLLHSALYHGQFHCHQLLYSLPQDEGLQ